MQDKCKFSQRGHELGTRIASVETAACVRLVANQHHDDEHPRQSDRTSHRASRARASREKRLQLCTGPGLAWPGLHWRTADRSCFIPSSLVRLCVYLEMSGLVQLELRLRLRLRLGRQILILLFVISSLARTECRVPSPEFHLIQGRVRTSRSNTFMNGFYYFIKRHMSASS